MTLGTTSASPPTGYSFLGQEVTITAPNAPDQSHPLVITFTLDASLNPDPSVIQVSGNGVLISACDASRSVVLCASIPVAVDANGGPSRSPYTRW